MENDIEAFSSVISRTFDKIKITDIEDASNVMSVWNNVLYKVKSLNNPNEGRNLAEHSRVIDLKNGVLLVEADHPGWIELLQMHRKFILKGMKDSLPQLSISTMAFILKGMKGNLYDCSKSEYSDAKVKDKIQKNIDREQEVLDKSGYGVGKNTYNKELPPELASIFDDLKKNMLTNSKK